MKSARKATELKKFGDLKPGDAFTYNAYDDKVFVKMEDIFVSKEYFANSACITDGTWTFINDDVEVSFEKNAEVLF